MDYTWRYDSPLGPITLASDGAALTGLWFEGQAHFASTLDAIREARALPLFDEACRWLDTYFSGAAPDFTPALDPRGTAFRRKVWALLQAIPNGQVVTYGMLAAETARQMGLEHMSPRAVGGAIARNPIALIIPCHRVIGANGRLTGYAGGVDRKARLLRLEGISNSDF